ncbi:MAG: phage major capsid protein [Candidatus Sulfotelmatobacter sp.]
MSTPTFKTLSPAAILEITRLNDEAETLLKGKNGVVSRGDAKRVDTILARISAIKAAGITDDESRRLYAEQLGAEIDAKGTRAAAAHENLFKRFMHAPDGEIEAIETELRANDYFAGIQTIGYTQGPVGGFLVPQSFTKNVATGLALVDPLLSPDVCTVITENDFRLPPLQLPGWDLSTIAAVKVSEGAQHAPDTVPGTTQKLLNKFTYRLSLGASFEWEDDQRTFDSAMAAMATAYGIGFARGIGADLISGDGSTAPAGILSGLSATVTTESTGVVVADDINNVFFSVNAIYRASPKCAWLMNDASYKLVRKAKDSNNRPLLSMVDDKLVLLGKPVHISPSLPTYNASLGEQAPGSFCVFGDLAHFYVHNTTLLLRRRLNTPGYVENGKALYTGLMSADAILHDPTNGALPPIVAAALHE